MQAFTCLGTTCHCGGKVLTDQSPSSSPLFGTQIDNCSQDGLADKARLCEASIRVGQRLDHQRLESSRPYSHCGPRWALRCNP